MLKRVIAGTKRAFGLKPAGRNLTVFSDDAFLVSYPKSGNTWARFLIANLLRPNEKVGFANIHGIIPGIDVVRHRDMLRMPRPRIIKSHQYFDPRYRRVVYIVRDPRDVALSEYHAQRKSKRIRDDHPIEEFVRRRASRCLPTCRPSRLAPSLGPTGQPGFLLLRYEDMLQDTARELSRMADFLGLHSTPELIQQAVSRSSADTMRTLEKSQAQRFNATKDTRQDILFVRSAKAGEWRSGLPEASILQIERAWGHLVQWLGYELVAEAKASTPEAVFPLSAVDGPVR
jgi:acyl carrier protein phosphodiesterase